MRLLTSSALAAIIMITNSSYANEYTAVLSEGKHRLQFDNNTTEHKFTLSGSELMRLSLSHDRDVDIDMYVNYGDNPVPLNSSSNLANRCAPWNAPSITQYNGSQEECSVNLAKTNQNEQFKVLFKYSSDNPVSNEAIVRYYPIDCKPYLYSTRTVLKLCPVTHAQERHNYSYTEKYRWKVTPESSLHTDGDIHARDINRGGGNSDKGEHLFAGFSGKVIFAGYSSKYGYNIVIYNSQYKVAARYAHLSYYTDETSVATGQHIGQIGNSGTIDAHLHMAVYRGLEIDSSGYNSLEQGKRPALKYAAQFEFPSRNEFDIRP
jgi:hypothetical protein